jgi:DNA repair exonuclease SbcCD ATPase subunit
MKLLRLKVAGFGPLQGEYAFQEGRLALLIDDNERGKSSLLAAIGAALYGLEADRRSHRMITPLERWRPWKGGDYRVELEFEHDGERYSVKRDFDRGSVEVWNSRGREVTEEFREGKEDYSVGRKLFGLDAMEFEKCAWLRQGELDAVVPADEKGRRNSTLHARLESAADTRVGDTNASEALQVLEGALRRYNCPELDTTLTVENAIKALEARHGMVEVEIKTLENDVARVAEPLEELARLAEEEKVARYSLQRLDAERREAMGADVQRQIKQHVEQTAALEKLKAEADSLAGAAHLPSNSEAELRETIARHEEAQHTLEALEARRRDEQARERGALEAEAETLRAYADCTTEDADRFVALASDIRRIAEEDSRLRTEVFQLRESLAGRGYEPERIQLLTSRFAGLGEAKQKLLRGQSEIALVFQTEVAGLEQVRTESTETLRSIDALRNSRRLPGWFLTALGLGTAVAGGVVFALHGQNGLWTAMLVVGGVAIVAGLLMLRSGAQARADEREDALRSLSDAQRRLNQLRGQRAEAEVALGEMSRDMGYRDPVELIREWGEYARLMEDSSPVMRSQERIATLEAQRKTTLDEVRGLLERVGGGSPEPAHLEHIAARIRSLKAVQQRLAELERNWSWIDEERRVAEASATGLKERALRILQGAGLTYDPSRTWAEHVQDLVQRVNARARHATLTEQLIPQAEGQLRPAEEIEALRNQLKLLDSERSPAEAELPRLLRSPIEIEQEGERYRASLDAVQKRRENLRLTVDETWRRHHNEHPEKQVQKERLETALERARRFHRAVELARDTIQSVAVETHRRWADHLNLRVAEILRTVGTRVEDLRFGEDLDFSVKFWNGQQVARGKAVVQLSAGARDQLHFAVRLAVSEYLSRGQEPVPLLIDDAFASSDDARARAGMKLLLEHFATRHQIIMVTCHRRRYEALAALDPELYSGRVQWLEARTADSPA